MLNHPPPQLKPVLSPGALVTADLWTHPNKTVAVGQRKVSKRKTLVEMIYGHAAL